MDYHIVFSHILNYHIAFPVHYNKIYYITHVSNILFIIYHEPYMIIPMYVQHFDPGFMLSVRAAASAAQDGWRIWIRRRKAITITARRSQRNWGEVGA